MSKRTIERCDRCGKEAEGKEAVDALKLSRIAVGRSISYSSYSGQSVYGASRAWDGEWCQACCVEVGVDNILPEDQDRPKNAHELPAPTLEQMIREIVRAEINQ